MKKQTRGIIDAIISSSTFGFSPFFSVSLLAMGLGALDVLSYRWGIATLVLLLIAIWTKKSVRLDRIESTKLTLYVMGFSAIYFLAGVTAMGGIRIIPGPVGWMYVAGISIICTMVSNFFLVNAVKNAGPTLASVFGALEPLTAVLTGVLFLEERLSVLNIAGIIMILTTVTIVVIYQNKQKA